MIAHGYVPKGFLMSQIVPIPKSGKKSANDINNYRGIALSSVLLKVFDKIVIILHSNVLSTSDVQYGFKKKHFTTQCIFVLEEIIQYYKNRNSSVYLLMLDASKAFDRDNYVKLFHLLIGRGLFVYMYVFSENTGFYVCSTSFCKMGQLLKFRIFCV